MSVKVRVQKVSLKCVVPARLIFEEQNKLFNYSGGCSAGRQVVTLAISKEIEVELEFTANL